MAVYEVELSITSTRTFTIEDAASEDEAIEQAKEMFLDYLDGGDVNVDAVGCLDDEDEEDAEGPA